MTKTFCDGCGKEFKRSDDGGGGDRPILEIKRVNGFLLGGLPSHTAHLCERCGKTVWKAVQAISGGTP